MFDKRENEEIEKRKQEWEDIHAACFEYVKTCTRMVSRYERKEEGKKSVVPYQWHIVQLLTRGNLDNLESVWNMPVAQALCLFNAYAETQGDDSILSEKAQEMEDNWDKYKDVEGTRKIEIA